MSPGTPTIPDYLAGTMGALGALVAPQHRRSKVFRLMIEEVADHVLEARGVCGWDVCAYNEEVLGFSTMIGQLLHSRLDCTIEEIDVQRYSASVAHGPLSA